MIYLDNAATTFPKPRCVAEAVSRAISRYGGNPGRGSHAMSVRSAEMIYDAREALADFFGAPSPDGVMFALNTTHALNTAIKACVKRGDHVLISSMEHNSVLRPVSALARRGVVTYDVFDAFSDDPVAAIEAKLRRETSLVVCAHSSNVCGRTLPIREIGAFLHARGVRFIVDGAQSAGKREISVREDKIDALCVPGHKGLYGTMGCGALIAGEGFPTNGGTLVEGGAGINSLDEEMPAFLPERYEAGTLPVTAVAGLLAGVGFVCSVGIDRIAEHEERLCRECAVRLREMPRVTLYSESGVILFNVDGVPSPRVCEALDREGICVRGGFHCSPLAHRALGTGEDGAVRASFGYFNTRSDALRLCDAVSRIRAER